MLIVNWSNPLSAITLIHVQSQRRPVACCMYVCQAVNNLAIWCIIWHKNIKLLTASFGQILMMTIYWGGIVMPEWCLLLLVGDLQNYNIGIYSTDSGHLVFLFEYMPNMNADYLLRGHCHKWIISTSLGWGTVMHERFMLC